MQVHVIAKTYTRVLLLYSNCCKAAKASQLFPHRVSDIQKLLPPHCETHHYCEYLPVKVEDDPRMFDFFLRYEFWFQVTGYVNSCNTYMRLTENPHGTHGTFLHPLRVELWCAISCHRIVGLIFFEDAINSGSYIEITH